MRLPPQHWTAAEYQCNLLAPVGIVTNAMERTGVPIDPERLRAIDADMTVKAEALRAELRQWCGRDINWNSWQQLAHWLHDERTDGGLGLPPSPYCKKGEVPDDKIATDDRALEWLAGHNPEQRQGIQTLRSLRTHERMGRYARSWLDVAIPHPDGTWRLHPSFGLATDRDNRPGAKTGRFGVKTPALNQVPTRTDAAGELGIPKDPAYIRRAFVAPVGKKLIVVDYSQLEIVLLAHCIAFLFGEDDPLVQLVRSGRDIHGPLAKFAFGELAVRGLEQQLSLHPSEAEAQHLLRQLEEARAVASAPIEMRPDTNKPGEFKEYNEFKIAKALKLLRDLAKAGIYGNNYGKGKKGFATSVFLPDGSPLGDERAELLVNALRELYPGIVNYQEHIRAFIERFGYIVSLYGRWMPLPDARAQQRGLRNRAYRQALNYPMQAGGQEVMALALIAIHNHPRLRELGFELILVVHDEILGMVAEEHAEETLAIVEYIMVSVADLLTPLKAEGGMGDNWKDTKK
jgi:DNA polymerase I